MKFELGSHTVIEFSKKEIVQLGNDEFVIFLKVKYEVDNDRKYL